MLPVISLSLIVTVSGQSESWSWAEDRTEDRIVGRFVSEEQSLQVVDPVLGSLSTQLADPSQFSDPELASLSAQFSNSVPGVEAGQLSEPEADGDSNGVLQGQFTQEETEPLTLIEGDTRGGFSIFYPDDGLDTGDLLLTRECNVSINDTVDSLYNNFMYPEGVKAMGEAVQMIAEETAVRIKQPEVGATYDAYLNKPEVCRVNLNQTAKQIHNFIRGLDSNPGAWALLEGKETKLFNSRLW